MPIFVIFAWSPPLSPLHWRLIADTVIFLGIWLCVTMSHLAEGYVNSWKWFKLIVEDEYACIVDEQQKLQLGDNFRQLKGSVHWGLPRLPKAGLPGSQVEGGQEWLCASLLQPRGPGQSKVGLAGERIEEAHAGPPFGY